jgi:hypothetical protein
MSANHKYYPEHLIGKAEKYLNINQQISLEIGDEHLQLTTPDEIKLAAYIVASYHNQYVCVTPNYENLNWITDDFDYET